MILFLVIALYLPAQQPDLFETKVRPTLVKNCYGCHGPDKQFSSLRVDSRESLLEGGKRGPAIAPGDENSLLLRALRHTGDLRMPPGAKLNPSELAAIESWIKAGAPWPQSAGPKRNATEDNYRRLVRTHWAFQPVKPPADRGIDSHIRARLRAAKLTPAAPAHRRILQRRLSYVLTGLPPSPDEVDAFLKNTAPDAYEKEVDRLLASPHFGEQWARHWMDLARFGETRGYEWNYEVLGAWRYRDYLIRAFNSGVPYDQFIREQIAGDLLDNPRMNQQEGINESLIGPAFFRLGEAGHDDCIKFREIATDVIDNQIDSLTKTFQGLTVSCARCHNHKLDPIPTEDYYGLYSILNSSQQVTHTLDLPGLHEEKLAAMRRVKTQLRDALSAQWSADVRSGSWRTALESKGQSIDDPAFVYVNFSGRNWPDLRAKVTAEIAARQRFDRENFDELPLNTFARSGLGLREGKDGEFAVAPSGDRVVTGVFPKGYYTHLDTTRLNGAMRLANIAGGRKYLSVRVMGGMLGSHRVVVDNCAIGEGNKVIGSEKLAWSRIDAIRNDQKLPAAFELITRFDNPRIPDRPGVLKGPHLEMMSQPHSYFGIVRAVLHDVNETPREDLDFLTPVFDGGDPSSKEEIAARYQTQLLNAIEHWRQDAATPRDVAWLAWLLENQAVRNVRNASPAIERLVDQYRQIDGTIPEPRVVEGLADIAAGRDFPVLLSGDPRSHGPAAPRRYLRMLFGDTPFATKGSGRRELAERIASPNNPLTARVMVNRLWHHVFGQGLVRSVDNFGILAEKPSHPELLDALAAQFVEDGWSIKKMIRRMVLSDTFRQSGESIPAALEADPQNALLSRYPLRRLTAESLRDSILASTGVLKPDMFGPSVDPWRDKPQDYRRLFSGPLDGAGRRSLYLKVTRMEGARFLETFDYPNPMTTRGSRDVTNVPAQALTLLNDPFILDQAAKLGDRVRAASVETFDQRLDALFRFTLGRSPRAEERSRFAKLADELGRPDERQLWAHLAHAVFNLKEFLYIP